MSRKIYLIIILCISLLGMFPGCSSESSTEPPIPDQSSVINLMKRFPNNADSFGYQNIESILSDKDLKQMLCHYTELDETYGFLPNQEAGTSGAVIWIGDIPYDELESEFNEHTSKIDYQGIDFWPESPGYTAITFLNDSYTFGTDESVKACIDASLGKRLSLYEENDYIDIIDKLPPGIKIQIWKDNFTHKNLEYDGLIISGYSCVKATKDSLTITAILKFTDRKTASDALDDVRQTMEDFDNPISDGPSLLDSFRVEGCEGNSPIKADYRNVNVSQDNIFLIVHATRNIPAGNENIL